VSRLSKRERATTAAALLELRTLGVDPGEVTNTAATLIRMGTPDGKAYQRAFGKLLEARPSLRAPLQRIETLIERSDLPTVARYNTALTNYMATGDEGHLRSIAATVSTDMAQLAQETGDAGFADSLPDKAPEPDAAPAVGKPVRPGWNPSGFRPGEAGEAQAPAQPGS